MGVQASSPSIQVTRIWFPSPASFPYLTRRFFVLFHVVLIHRMACFTLTSSFILATPLAGNWSEDGQFCSSHSFRPLVRLFFNHFQYLKLCKWLSPPTLFMIIFVSNDSLSILTFFSVLNVPSISFSSRSAVDLSPSHGASIPHLPS